MNFYIGHAESTRINDASEFQPGQKREPFWWLETSASEKLFKLKVQEELEAKFMKAEYEASFNSTFDPNMSHDEVDASKDIISTFPIGLNPKFDMQAYFTVSLHYRLFCYN